MTASTVEARIRALLQRDGGRVRVDDVAREALGLAGAQGALARRLVETALRDLRGLALEGDEVVERAIVAPAAGRRCVLALAPQPTRSGLPPVAAWLDLPPRGEPTVVALAGEGWRSGVASLAEDLAGCEVLALSAGSARRVLRLGASVAGLDPAREPRVLALGVIARRAGHPIKGPEDAAALVGAVVPEGPEDAARLLVRVAEALAAAAGTDVAGLRELAEAEAVPEFDFGERAFGREDLLALPESPGIYVFEDVQGDVAYVGKASNLRRRVGSYFAANADERAARVRDAAHALGVERTGTELSALLRERQLIRELSPGLNVQEQVHDRGRSVASLPQGLAAVVQPSAEGGAEIVLLHPARGVSSLEVVAESSDADVDHAIREALDELSSRDPDDDEALDVQVAITWLADSGQSASLVDASGEPAEVASLLTRLARDPDLRLGRIVPVR